MMSEHTLSPGEQKRNLADLILEQRDKIVRLQSELNASRDEAENLRGRAADLEFRAMEYLKAAPGLAEPKDRIRARMNLEDAINHCPDPKPFILRKQAEAVEAIKPTAEMKAEMLGSFKITEELTCSACYFDEPDNDCEVCAGDVTYAQDFQIPWHSQKQIIDTAKEHVAQRLRQQADEAEGGKHCTYPSCRCPFDRGTEFFCLRGLPEKPAPTKS